MPLSTWPLRVSFLCGNQVRFCPEHALLKRVSAPGRNHLGTWACQPLWRRSSRGHANSTLQPYCRFPESLTRLPFVTDHCLIDYIFYRVARVRQLSRTGQCATPIVYLPIVCDKAERGRYRRRDGVQSPILLPRWRLGKL